MNINIKEITIGSRNSCFIQQELAATETYYSTADIKHYIRVVGDNIVYKMYNTDEDKLYYHAIIPFSLIRQHSSFVAQTLWAVKDTAMPLVSSLEDEENGITVKFGEIISLFDLSLQERDPVLGSKKYDTELFPLKIFVPYDNCPIEDLHFMLTCDKANNSTYEIDAEPESSIVVNSGYKDIVATISTEHTIVDGVINVNISTDPRLNTIYLEAVSGILNKTRVALNNGEGSFTIVSTGLSTGDVVDVKLGHKKFVSVNRIQITL